MRVKQFFIPLFMGASLMAGTAMAQINFPSRDDLTNGINGQIGSGGSATSNTSSNQSGSDLLGSYGNALAQGMPCIGQNQQGCDNSLGGNATQTNNNGATGSGSNTGGTSTGGSGSGSSGSGSGSSGSGSSGGGTTTGGGTTGSGSGSGSTGSGSGGTTTSSGSPDWDKVSAALRELTSLITKSGGILDQLQDISDYLRTMGNVWQRSYGGQNIMTVEAQTIEMLAKADTQAIMRDMKKLGQTDQGIALIKHLSEGMPEDQLLALVDDMRSNNGKKLRKAMRQMNRDLRDDYARERDPQQRRTIGQAIRTLDEHERNFLPGKLVTQGMKQFKVNKRIASYGKVKQQTTPQAMNMQPSPTINSVPEQEDNTPFIGARAMGDRMR